MLFGALPRALRFERSGLGIFTGRFAPEDPRLGKPLPVSLRPFRQGKPVSIEMPGCHASVELQVLYQLVERCQR